MSWHSDVLSAIGAIPCARLCALSNDATRAAEPERRRVTDPVTKIDVTESLGVNLR